MIDRIKKLSYIHRGGNHCPYCGSENIESGVITFETEVSAPVGCNDCAKEWIDIYKICDVQEV
jgi:formate dehydrogenase maturation protein FdhE